MTRMLGEEILKILTILAILFQILASSFAGCSRGTST